MNGLQANDKSSAKRERERKRKDVRKCDVLLKKSPRSHLRHRPLHDAKNTGEERVLNFLKGPGKRPGGPAIRLSENTSDIRQTINGDKKIKK